MSTDLWWMIPAWIVGGYFFLMMCGVLGGVVMMTPPFRVTFVDLEKLMLESFSAENCRWIIDHSLTIRGSYCNAFATLHIFALPDCETELALMKIGTNTALAFQTKLGGGYSLETGNSADGEAAPPPSKVYRQTMAASYLEELYQDHKESLSFLAQAKKLYPIPIVAQEELLAELQRDIRRELKEVFLNPKTVILLPYLYFTKHRRVNRTIAQQLQVSSGF